MHGTIALKNSTATLELPAEIAAPSVPNLPKFQSRWWHKPNRLDARPVIWSLYNHPEEWEPGDSRPYYFIKHTPSGHVFRMRNGKAALVGPQECSCLGRSEQGRFQLFQGLAFKRAARVWEYNHDHPPIPPVDREQFAAHFIR